MDNDVTTPDTPSVTDGLWSAVKRGAGRSIASIGSGAEGLPLLGGVSDALKQTGQNLQSNNPAPAAGASTGGRVAEAAGELAPYAGSTVVNALGQGVSDLAPAVMTEATRRIGSKINEAAPAAGRFAPFVRGAGTALQVAGTAGDYLLPFLQARGDIKERQAETGKPSEFIDDAGAVLSSVIQNKVPGVIGSALGKFLPAAKTVVGGIAQKALTEGAAGFGVANAGVAATERASGGQDLTSDDAAQEIGASALGGAVTGAGLIAGTHALHASFARQPSGPITGALGHLAGHEPAAPVFAETPVVNNPDGTQSYYGQGGQQIPKNPKLSPAEQDVEGRAADQVLADPQKAIADYRNVPGTDNGRIISADNARELFPDYNASDDTRSANSAAVQEPASYLTKQVYADALSQPVKDDKDATVFFSAGGTGAGKTTALSQVPDVQQMMDRADLVYDGTMSNFNSAKDRIDAALDSGRNVNIGYINRDPVDSFTNGALPRAVETGRTVPLDAHISAHIGAAKTIQELQEAYKDDPRVNIEVINNSTGEKPQVGQVADVAKTAGMDDNTLRSQLVDSIVSGHEGGKVPDRVYNYYAKDIAEQDRSKGAGSQQNPAGATQPEGVGQTGGVGDRDQAGASPEAKGSASAGQVARTLFEVAPDPNDRELSKSFNNLSNDQKDAITQTLHNQITPRVLDAVGVRADKFVKTYGGYGDDVNPSLSVQLDTGSRADKLRAASALGKVFNQDSTILLDPHGKNKVGVVSIDLPKGVSRADVSRIYAHLRQELGDKVSGFTGRADGIDILNFDKKTDTKALQRDIGKVLEKYDSDLNAHVDTSETAADFIGRKDYEGNLREGSSIQQRQKLGDLGQQAGASLRDHIQRFAGQNSEVRASRTSARRDERDVEGQRREEKPGAVSWLKPAVVSKDTPTFHSHKPLPDAVSAVGIHYSGKEGLTALDPSYAGSGSAGGERRRFGQGQFGTGEGTAKRVYFYAQEGSKIPGKEAAVAGQHAYRVKMDNLYDASTDHLGLKNEHGLNGDAFEEDLHERGYDGYITHAFGQGVDNPTIVAFGFKNKIPVESVNTNVRAGRQAPSAKGLPKERVQQLVDNYTSKFGPNGPNVVVTDHAHLPDDVKNSPAYDKNNNGFSDGKGNIYLMHDKMNSIYDVKTVLAHEAYAHFGLKGVLGDKISEFREKVNEAAKEEGPVRDVARYIDKTYGELSPEERADEIVAHMAEHADTLTGKAHSLLARAVVAVRDWLSKTFGRHNSFDENSILSMIAKSKEHLESPTKSNQPSEPSEGRASMAATAPAGGFGSVIQNRQAATSIKDAALVQRELARNAERSSWAQRDREIGKADAAVDRFRSYFDARPKDIRSDPAKSYEPIIQYQQGKTITDPKAKEFVEQSAKMLDEQATAIRAYGEDKLGLLQQYYPQLWKDPVAAQKLYTQRKPDSGLANNQKRPLGGNSGFRKERVFADYEEGIKAGFEPKFDNPVDALMARYQAGERYLSSLAIKADLDRLNLTKDIPTNSTGTGEGRIPEGFARVNDATFNGKMVPELVAKDLNNYLAPGLSQFAAWRGFRSMQNTLLSARLGLSAFHAGFTTFDSAVTQLDLAARYLADGNIPKALSHLGGTIAAPLRALQGLANKGPGATLVKQFYGRETIKDPNTAAILDALTEGGARGKMDATDTNNDWFKAKRTLATEGLAGLVKTPLQSLGAVIEGAMRPIATALVPAQKMTARAELMKYELDHIAKQLGQKPGDYAEIVKAMNPDALRQIAHSVVQRVDDRLGQVAYDNLFWNRTAKDIAQASIQSVGWNVGTMNVIGGGIKDFAKVFNPEKLIAPLDAAGKITDAHMSRVSGRLSYLVALNAGIGALGAMTQVMLTGKGPDAVYDKDGFHPEHLKDYFFPRTGQKNPDGTDARIAFPSYVKDEFGFASHPIDTVEHKLHPSFSMIAELLNNKDFFGNRVYDPDAPWSKVAGQVAQYVGEGFIPYAFQNRAQVAKTGGGIGAQAAPFFGITPAAGDITHSRFENYVSQRYYEDHPSGVKNPDEANQSKQFMDAAAALKLGQQPDLSGFSPKEKLQLQKYVTGDSVAKHFAGLPIEQRLVAWDHATPEERDKHHLKASLAKGLTSQLINMQPDERKAVIQKLRAALSGESA